MSRQGFTTINTDPYVYIENTTNNTVSASIGINSAGTGLFNINLSTSAGAAPGTGFQPMAVDPVTGVITFTPLGGGYVLVDGPLQTTAGVTYEGDILTLNDAASAAANSVIIEKDRAGGVITTGDALGQIYFKGYSGAAYVTGASITSTSSGTIGANRVAGNLVFGTHPDSASGANATTRMTIASTGEVTIAAPDSGVGLTISGGGCAVTGLVSATTTLSAGTTVTAGTGITITAGDLTATNGDAVLGNTDAAVTAPIVDFKKSRAGTVITSGDVLGSITFRGVGTGSTYTTGASITCTSSGTIAADRVASNMVFATHPDSASGATPTTRMTIASTGAVTIASPDSGVGLTVAGGGVTVTAGGATVTAGDVTVTNGDVIISTATKGVTLPGGLRVITGAKATVTGITAPIGSLFLSTDGAGVNDRAYINTDGGTTWTALVTVA